MAFKLPPPPTENDISSPSFRDWFYKLQQFVGNAGNILFTELNFFGSNITSIETRNHADLQNLNTASFTHLTSTQATDLTDGGDSVLHFHSSDRALDNATGVLGFVNGGTGLSALGTANQVLAVNAGATALEFQTPSGGSSTVVNKLTTTTTVPVDTSYVVLSYLDLNNNTMNVSGNLGVFG